MTQAPSRAREATSFRQVLRAEGKSNRQFEKMIDELSLEEVIALKLDVAASAFRGRRLMGVPLWKMIPRIAKRGILIYAMASAAQLRDQASVLGLSIRNMRYQVYRLDLQNHSLARKLCKLDKEGP